MSDKSISSTLSEINKKIDDVITWITKIENASKRSNNIYRNFNKSKASRYELPTEEKLNHYKINYDDYITIAYTNKNWIRTLKYADMFSGPYYDDIRGSYNKKFINFDTKKYEIVNEHRPDELSAAVRNIVNENRHLMNEKDSLNKAEFIAFINSVFNKRIPVPKV